jgi:hypothetical protein
VLAPVATRETERTVSTGWLLPIENLRTGDAEAMTNPDRYEDDLPANTAATVLGAAGRIVAGILLMTMATTAIVAYVAARAGQDARERVNGAIGDVGRAIRAAGEQVTGTTRAALGAAAGPGEQPDTTPAVLSPS